MFLHLRREKGDKRVREWNGRRMDSKVQRIFPSGEIKALWRRKRKDNCLRPWSEERLFDNQVNKASSNQWNVTRKLRQIEDLNHPSWLCKPNSNLKHLWAFASWFYSFFPLLVQNYTTELGRLGEIEAASVPRILSLNRAWMYFCQRTGKKTNCYFVLFCFLLFWFFSQLG